MNEMQYENHKLICQFCREKILVEIYQFGISHIGSIVAYHGDCIKKHGVYEPFKKEYPEEAKDVDEWLKESGG